MKTRTERRRWSASDVRAMCIRYGRYTNGTCGEYDKMLDFVANNEPTITNIEIVAEDIVRHSEMDKYGILDFDELVDVVMFDIANDCITYSFQRA